MLEQISERVVVQGRHSHSARAAHDGRARGGGSSGRKVVDGREGATTSEGRRLRYLERVSGASLGASRLAVRAIGSYGPSGTGVLILVLWYNVGGTRQDEA